LAFKIVVYKNTQKETVNLLQKLWQLCIIQNKWHRDRRGFSKMSFMLSQKEKEQGEEGEREVLAEERVPTPVKKWKDTEQKEDG
jgi:hypothetical protein